METLQKELFPRDHHHLPIFIALIALILGLAVVLGVISQGTGGGKSHANLEQGPVASLGDACDGVNVLCASGLMCSQGTCVQNPSSQLPTVANQGVTSNDINPILNNESVDLANPNTNQ